VSLFARKDVSSAQGKKKGDFIVSRTIKSRGCCYKEKETRGWVNGFLLCLAMEWGVVKKQYESKQTCNTLSAFENRVLCVCSYSKKGGCYWMDSWSNSPPLCVCSSPKQASA
jgi:hypothetical protein